MDQFIAWSLALVAVVTFTAAAVLDRYTSGTEFGRSGHLLILVANLVSVGTLVVSTLAITGNSGSLLTLVAGFNRAVLAGAGCIVLNRAWHRFRARPRVR